MWVSKVVQSPATVERWHPERTGVASGLWSETLAESFCSATIFLQCNKERLGEDRADYAECPGYNDFIVPI